MDFDLPNLLLGLVLGYVLAVAVEYSRPFVRQMGESHAKRLRGRRSTKKVERAKKRYQDEADKKYQAIRNDRVGARFRKREMRDDPWIEGTVVEVPPQPKQGQGLTNVVMVWDTPDGPDRVCQEWRWLTKPAAQQRHYTARFVMDQPGEDGQGWTQVERLD